MLGRVDDTEAGQASAVDSSTGLAVGHEAERDDRDRRVRRGLRPLRPGIRAGVGRGVRQGVRRTGRAASAGYLWLRPRPTGVTIGALFFCTSLAPSLLPRPWLAQGLSSGVALALGYGIGSVAGRVAGLTLRIPRAGP